MSLLLAEGELDPMDLLGGMEGAEQLVCVLDLSLSLRVPLLELSGVSTPQKQKRANRGTSHYA